MGWASLGVGRRHVCDRAAGRAFRASACRFPQLLAVDGLREVHRRRLVWKRRHRVFRSRGMVCSGRLQPRGRPAGLAFSGVDTLSFHRGEPLRRPDAGAGGVCRQRGAHVWSRPDAGPPLGRAAGRAGGGEQCLSLLLQSSGDPRAADDFSHVALLAVGLAVAQGEAALAEERSSDIDRAAVMRDGADQNDRDLSVSCGLLSAVVSATRGPSRRSRQLGNHGGFRRPAVARVLPRGGQAPLPAGLSLSLHRQRLSATLRRGRMVDGLLVFVARRSLDRPNSDVDPPCDSHALDGLVARNLAQSVVRGLVPGRRGIPVLHRVPQQHAAALLPGDRLPARDRGRAWGAGAMAAPRPDGARRRRALRAGHLLRRRGECPGDGVVDPSSAIHVRRRGTEPHPLYRPAPQPQPSAALDQRQQHRADYGHSGDLRRLRDARPSLTYPPIPARMVRRLERARSGHAGRPAHPVQSRGGRKFPGLRRRRPRQPDSVQAHAAR